MSLLQQAEPHLLGHSQDEERRLNTQAEELQLFDHIGIESGSRAIDLGCGPQGVPDHACGWRLWTKGETNPE